MAVADNTHLKKFKMAKNFIFLYFEVKWQCSRYMNPISHKLLLGFYNKSFKMSVFQ